ncbi:MAG: hypothetical protein K2X52_21370 [Mycobacteriaceae bacterium]|nr:hypothetical protein [Mycobacteriaceae bacterium]
MATELTDMRFGENRLQRTSSRQPFVVHKVEQVPAEQVPHFLMDDRLFDAVVLTAQNAANALRLG